MLERWASILIPPHRRKNKLVVDLHQVLLLVLLQHDKTLQCGGCLPGAPRAVHHVLARDLLHEQDVEHLGKKKNLISFTNEKNIYEKKFILKNVGTFL